MYVLSFMIRFDPTTLEVARKHICDLNVKLKLEEFREHL